MASVRTSRISNIDFQAIHERYIKGEGIGSLCKEFGICPATAHREFKNQGLKIISPEERDMSKCRWDAFKDAGNNEFAAYWIGMLITDGCVQKHSKNSYRMSLGLAGDDGYHVREFHEWLGEKTKIIVSQNGTNIITTSITSCQMLIADAMKYGVVPKKSMKMVAVGLELNRHFWRGVICGNGCLSMRKYKGKFREYPYFSLSASKLLLDQFCAYIKEFIGVVSVPKKIKRDFVRNRPDDESLWIVGIHNEKAKNVVSHFFDNATIALNRKSIVAAKIAGYDNRLGCNLVA